MTNNNLKPVCECLTYTLTLEIEAHLAQSAELLKNAKDASNLKRQLKALRLAVDKIMAGLEEHERLQREFIQEVLEFMKKDQINVAWNERKVKTVPWTTGKARQDQLDFKERKNKK